MSWGVPDGAGCNGFDALRSQYSQRLFFGIPDVEIEFVPSTETPVGLGEPATIAVAPAMGMRSLPLVEPASVTCQFGEKRCYKRARTEHD